MQLEKLIRDEAKPLQAIFKQLAKFNKSVKELKKYVFETMSDDE